MYTITNYTKEKAKKLNVIVKLSTKNPYKIDVFDKKGNYITSCGNVNYPDYPTYLKTHSKEYAEERRRLYHARFKKSGSIVGSRSYYSLNLLW